MITDLHMDYDYTIGASIVCNRPACCRSDSGKGLTPEDSARKWGDFGCDMTELALDSMLSYISTEIKPDAVMWAGDSVGHYIDELSPKIVVDVMDKVTNQVKKGLEGYKVYPSIGNHDSYPANVISR